MFQNCMHTKTQLSFSEYCDALLQPNSEQQNAYPSENCAYFAETNIKCIVVGEEVCKNMHIRKKIIYECAFYESFAQKC